MRLIWRWFSDCRREGLWDLGEIKWWTWFWSQAHPGLDLTYWAGWQDGKGGRRLQTERVYVGCCCLVASVVDDSLWHHGLLPFRLLCPWDFPGKNIEVGCHFLLQGIFLTQGLNLHLLHWQTESLPLSCQRSPGYLYIYSSLMATHSSTVAWKIPWTGSLVGYSPWGRRVGHDWATSLHFIAYSHRRTAETNITLWSKEPPVKNKFKAKKY